jgi:hypothetical protein
VNQPPGREDTGLPVSNAAGGASPPPANAGPSAGTSGDSRATIQGIDLDAAGTNSDTALLAYALSWFTYHAGQRQQSFNFFIALQTALIAVVVLQYGTAGRSTLVIFGMAGFVGTLLFAALEIRNTELVLAGGATLAGLEASFGGGAGSQTAAIPLPYAADNARLYLRKALVEFVTLKNIDPIGGRPASRRWYKMLGFVIRNSFVLRSIFLLTLAGWLVFVSLILTSYQPSRPSCGVTVRAGAVARVVCGTASQPTGQARTSSRTTA